MTGFEATTTGRWPPSGVLLDVDGTLVQDGRALPGAKRALGAVREAGLPLRLVTNTSRRSRGAVLRALSEAGLEAGVDEVLTAPVATAAWLRERGITGLALLAPEEVAEDFEGLDVDASSPGAVVVGDLGDAWSYEVLDRAFGWLLDGAELVAIHRNRYWSTGGGLHLDVGPFVAALEYASGRRATVLGKPHRAFFEMAARSMGLAPDAVVMVGDDLAADALGAMEAGATGMLVRTGKFREEELTASDRRPDRVLDGIGELADLVVR